MSKALVGRLEIGARHAADEMHVEVADGDVVDIGALAHFVQPLFTRILRHESSAETLRGDSPHLFWLHACIVEQIADDLSHGWSRCARLPGIGVVFTQNNRDASIEGNADGWLREAVVVG